jgi:hypothetical protein
MTRETRPLANPHLDKLGFFGAFCAAAFGMGCCGIPALTAGLVALGLGFFGRSWLNEPALYGGLALSVVGLAYSSWACRRVGPLVLGLLGAAAIFYGFRTVLDVPVFRGVVFGGLGAILAASVWSTILGRRCLLTSRRLPFPRPTTVGRHARSAG